MFYSFSSKIFIVALVSASVFGACGKTENSGSKSVEAVSSDLQPEDVNLSKDSDENQLVFMGKAVGSGSYKADGDCVVTVTKSSNSDIQNIEVTANGYEWGLDTGEKIHDITIDSSAKDKVGDEMTVEKNIHKSFGNIVAKTKLKPVNPESFQKLLVVQQEISLKNYNDNGFESLVAKQKITLDGGIGAVFGGRKEIRCEDLKLK